MSERSFVMRLTAERSKLSNEVRSAWSSDGEQRSRWSTFGALNDSRRRMSASCESIIIVVIIIIIIIIIVWLLWLLFFLSLSIYLFITGRICRRQLCRYFVYSRADFAFFFAISLQGATIKLSTCSGSAKSAR